MDPEYHGVRRKVTVERRPQRVVHALKIAFRTTPLLAPRWRDSTASKSIDVQRGALTRDRSWLGMHLASSGEAAYHAARACPTLVEARPIGTKTPEQTNPHDP